MKPALYGWKDMLHDYTQLLLNDRWYWCRHCRRPVEHVQIPPPGSPPDATSLTCLDCGYADPEFLHLPRM
ncbi:MAG TPA: hypothetical protein VGM37_05130 [Armatimonadota bacterium]|jgi:hypothetical protein